MPSKTNKANKSITNKEKFSQVKTDKLVVNKSDNKSENFAKKVLLLLKEDILKGMFIPGEKLKIEELKVRYNVGSSPLREALSQLLVEQLVVMENQKGFRVSPISLSELEDIYQARARIESICLSLAFSLRNDAWEANILAASHCLKKSFKLEKDAYSAIAEWEKLHQSFHSAICVGCQSDTLMAIRKTLYEKTIRYRNLWLKNNMTHSKIFNANLQEHEQLVAGILNNEHDKTTQLIITHIQRPVELIKKDWGNIVTN